MSRRGFALFTTLWLIMVVSAVAGVALVVAGPATAAGRNRILLVRGAWAAEACGEILLARFEDGAAVRAVDTTDLGQGVWCRAEIQDAGGRLDLNLASPAELRALFGSDTLADAVLDWRDPDTLARPLGAEAGWYRDRGRRLPRDGAFADLSELALVRGLDGNAASALKTVLTVRGGGRVDLNAAPRAVLAALPGMDPAAVAMVLDSQRSGPRIGSSDDLLARLPSRSRQSVLEHYQEFTAAATFTPARIVVRVEGGIRGMPVVSAARLDVVPTKGRLAVIRREAIPCGR